MTVRELIERLGEFNPDHEVKFAYNYGDYWRTEVAEGFTTVSEEMVVWSEYHRMHKTLTEEEEEERRFSDNPETGFEVVILR